MNNSIKFLIKRKDTTKRLDIFLSEKIKDLTRSNIKKIEINYKYPDYIKENIKFLSDWII